MQIKLGDVIGVRRLGRIYEHYGIFENENRIYQYAAQNGDFGNSAIHTTTLNRFIGDSGNCFVLIFPEKYGTPIKSEIPMHIHGDSEISAVFAPQSHTQKVSAYHLYTPEETIERAKSRLGENKYNLLFNNCEHYAIWCKTGIHESRQIEDLLKLSHKVKAAYMFSGKAYDLYNESR